MQSQTSTEIDLMGPLTPAFVDPKLVQENIKKFREFLPKILDPEVDIAIIQGKPFTRKSGWNVINQFWGVETKPTHSWRIELPDGEYAIAVSVEASKNGKNKVSRSGYCSTLEMKAKHNGKDYLTIDSHCHAMAETRAVGRASAAWYMIGDVSAEEVEGGPMLHEIPKDAKRACTCSKKGLKADCEPNSRNCKRCGGVDLG